MSERTFQTSFSPKNVAQALLLAAAVAVSVWAASRAPSNYRATAVIKINEGVLRNKGAIFEGRTEDAVVACIAALNAPIMAQAIRKKVEAPDGTAFDIEAERGELPFKIEVAAETGSANCAMAAANAANDVCNQMFREQERREGKVVENPVEALQEQEAEATEEAAVAGGEKAEAPADSKADEDNLNRLQSIVDDLTTEEIAKEVEIQKLEQKIEEAARRHLEETLELQTDDSETDERKRRYEEKLSDLMTRLSYLRSRYNDNHPDVIEAAEAIAALKKKIAGLPAATKKKTAPAPEKKVDDSLREELNDKKFEMVRIRMRLDDAEAELDVALGKEALRQARESAAAPANSEAASATVLAPSGISGQADESETNIYLLDAPAEKAIDLNGDKKLNIVAGGALFGMALAYAIPWLLSAPRRKRPAIPLPKLEKSFPLSNARGGAALKLEEFVKPEKETGPGGIGRFWDDVIQRFAPPEAPNQATFWVFPINFFEKIAIDNAMQLALHLAGKRKVCILFGEYGEPSADSSRNAAGGRELMDFLMGKASLDSILQPIFDGKAVSISVENVEVMDWLENKKTYYLRLKFLFETLAEAFDDILLAVPLSGFWLEKLEMLPSTPLVFWICPREAEKGAPEAQMVAAVSKSDWARHFKINSG